MVCVWCSLKPTSSLTFRSEKDSEGKEKQASEREIDCGSTGALAFKDVGDFRPRSLVNRPSLWRPPVYKMDTVLS